MSGGKSGSGEFSGLLRENIRIERPSMQRDASGSAGLARDVIGTFRAAAEPMGTGEEAMSESRTAMPRWGFMLRQTDMILPGDYLFWAGRKMHVRSVAADHRFIPKTLLQAEETG
ncbi:head-tail adaptor protein [Parasphingorhabdus sp. JC815]|uniref:head-tail adaptor protein n=1 Tax=Parasphingorhabdus sp. JC815 TaxID=3232140 RepID=UPI003459809C